MLIFLWVIIMNETEIIFFKLNEDIQDLLKKQEMVEKELAVLGTEQKAIVIKTIQGKQYYYEQWNADGKLMCRSLGRVRPGVISEEEGKIARRKELLDKKKEYGFLLEKLLGTKQSLEAKFRKEPVLSNFSFEVFWKDEIVASVRVKGARVEVSRFSNHPGKQLFYNTRMTRFQLNRILEMRCIEKERPDISLILRHLGLTEYNPLEIVRKTHGVSYNDYIWFRFPGERLVSKDVLVRKV